MRDRDNCFDLLRLVAAGTVLYAHCYSVLNLQQPLVLDNGLGVLGVAVFFAISGYLVTGSWIAEPRLSVFALKRVLRIAPALIPLGLACAALNASHVFDANQRSDLAPSLWTIPIEVKCYLVVALIGVLGLLRNRATVLGLWAVVLVLILRHQYPVGVQLASAKPFVVPAQMLVGIFFGGALMRWLPLRGYLAALALAVLVYASAKTLRPEWAWMLCIPYLTIYAGNLFTLHLKADASYGIYIWGFVVQQILVLDGVEVPVLIFVLALPLTYAIARLSWRLVEHPALRSRRRLHRLEVPAPPQVLIAQVEAEA